MKRKTEDILHTDKDSEMNELNGSGENLEPRAVTEDMVEEDSPSDAPIELQAPTKDQKLRALLTVYHRILPERFRLEFEQILDEQ